MRYLLEAGAGTGFNIAQLLPFLVIAVFFWLFFIRPQKKEQQKKQQMLNDLKKNDKVITIGGIHGVVQSIKEHSVVLKIDNNATIEIEKTSISFVVEEEKASNERGSGK